MSENISRIDDNRRKGACFFHLSLVKECEHRGRQALMLGKKVPRGLRYIYT